VTLGFCVGGVIVEHRYQLVVFPLSVSPRSSFLPLRLSQSLCLVVVGQMFPSLYLNPLQFVEKRLCMTTFA